MGGPGERWPGPAEAPAARSAASRILPALPCPARSDASVPIGRQSRHACPWSRQHSSGQAVTKTGHPAPCPKFGVMDPVTARAAGLFPLPL